MAAFLRAVMDGRVPRGSFLIVESLDRLSRQSVHRAALFQGSLDEARVTALQSNSRDKLPRRGEDKTEAAWRLVKEEKFSKQRLVDLGIVFYGTVGNVRAKWNEIKEAEDAKAQSLPWVQARHWKPGEWTDEEVEDWRERKIQSLVDRLIEAGLAAEMGKDTGLVVEALCRIVSDFPMMAVAISDPDAVLAWMQDFRDVDGRRAYHEDEDPDEHVF